MKKTFDRESEVRIYKSFEIREIDCYGTRTWTKTYHKAVWYILCNNNMKNTDRGIFLEKYVFSIFGRNGPKLVESRENGAKIGRDSGVGDPLEGSPWSFTFFVPISLQKHMFFLCFILIKGTWEVFLFWCTSGVCLLVLSTISLEINNIPFKFILFQRLM